MKAELERRDAWTALLLGGFLALFALPVFAGAVVADLPIDRVIAATAGLMLLAAGGGFLAWGWRRHRPRSAPGQDA
jgi:hypothetical protein